MKLRVSFFGERGVLVGVRILVRLTFVGITDIPPNHSLFFLAFHSM